MLVFISSAINKVYAECPKMEMKYFEYSSQLKAGPIPTKLYYFNGIHSPNVFWTVEEKDVHKLFTEDEINCMKLDKSTAYKSSLNNKFEYYSGKLIDEWRYSRIDCAYSTPANSSGIGSGPKSFTIQAIVSYNPYFILTSSDWSKGADVHPREIDEYSRNIFSTCAKKEDGTGCNFVVLQRHDPNTPISDGG